jgi:restriction system protein
MPIDKPAELLKLAKKRQATRWPGFNCIGDYHAGVYECDHVSPYTKTARNVDAEIMVMLQDWSSDEGMRGPVDEGSKTLGHTPGLATNRNLRTLLRDNFALDLPGICGTNLFPFIKLGGMSSKIAPSALVRAAREFALPQVEIVNPKLVICLGHDTYNALRAACTLDELTPMDKAIASPYAWQESIIWCQAHTGARGMNNRGREQVPKDWSRMAACYRDMPPDRTKVWAWLAKWLSSHPIP